MIIESDDYYQIILNGDHSSAGEQLLDTIIAELHQRRMFDEIEDLQLHIPHAYQLDTRCLIGFALAHDEYEFGVGGLSHVIGHNVAKPMRMVERIMSDLQHPSIDKITAMVSAMESAPH